MRRYITNIFDYALCFIQPYTLNFIDEQAGERGHKRYKHARSHLARKNSPEANIIDMLKLSLTWSDPKMSDEAYRGKKSRGKNDEEFTKAMARYYKCSENVILLPDTDTSDTSLDESREDSENE